MFGRPLPLTSLVVLAAFIATGGVIWLAYGQTLSVQGEPPLVKAAATPLKRAPDDPGGRDVPELGGIGELLADDVDGETDEQLMPAPEQPLSPAEEAIAALAQDGVPDGEAVTPEKRERAAAALKELVDELRANGVETPSGAGGPVNSGTEWTPSPARPADLVAAANDGITPLRNQVEVPRTPESSVVIRSSSPENQIAVTGDTRLGRAKPRFQGTPGGRFRVQLAAVREEADAERAWSQFQDQLGAYVGGLEPFIERADTANGTFYRVQIGPFAEGGNAANLCVELKKQNASCFVVSR